jgi:hypothetical protein
MPVADIIGEIDAYLSRLSQARELLSERTTEESPKQVARRETKVAVRKPEPASSSSQRTNKNKSRSNRPVAHLEEVRMRGGVNVQVPHTESNGVSQSEQPAISESERAIPQNIVITRLPASRRISSIRAAHRRTGKLALGSKPDPLKPAIALAGPTNSKIVVISAEQMKREREQVAPQPVLRPHPPTSGLSGKLAFAALFKDKNER